MKNLIVLRGGGDIASGIAHRLVRSGFLVIILETDQPTMVRRTVSFAQGIYDGEMMVEGITGKKVNTTKEALQIMDKSTIPLLIDPKAECISDLRPTVVVDAILAKKNIGTTIDMAPIVIGVGPGFYVGKDVHAVIETKRGHDLGRVLLQGQAIADTGIPGNIGGYTIERVLRAPKKGIFYAIKKIGDQVQKGEAVAKIDGEIVYASISGVLRGLLQNGILVSSGLKIGDIDPRAEVKHCYTISDKARSIGGGVLEALLYLKNR
ncbi:selenium-dependent molybdenum cofactor biosynthesis protein YqeB [Garciella nitratireducens]|uniref:selenium-dependent molybdenum cofactor biosynthesis protein YqeB n=1 Tax=Garciella nitratireducens TaxID=218205 RepID=UPI000DE9144E|nr:selenium-dependent molybdenum cofactor biosynthesis protein YqeB [Garciella nitratireducens]RBP44064.1 xanthine dehydrogenase accessory factor [Garciella nitratireducens]